MICKKEVLLNKFINEKMGYYKHRKVEQDEREDSVLLGG
jgi:hypothetical protein